MSIKSLPSYPPGACLDPEASLGDALGLMLGEQINHVPVCEASGRFAGIISTHAILRELIPASARVEGGLSSLKFAGDALPLLGERLRCLRSRKVGEFAEKDVSVLDEDCPILEAALKLTQSPGPLPVVGKDGRLRGMLSRRVLLAHLAQQKES